MPYVMIDIESDGPIPGDFSMICFGADIVEPELKRTFYGQLKPISDNNGFDWQFINWYFHHFLGGNPFGFSSTNLGSLYKGLAKDTFVNFKHLRKTKHTHHPVDDAMGNAEALLAMKEDMTKGQILHVAGTVGLDATRLESDMANPEWQTVIDRNRALAKDLGISGTPGFIVGTEHVPGVLDVNGLKDLVARNGTSQHPSP